MDRWLPVGAGLLVIGVIAVAVLLGPSGGDEPAAEAEVDAPVPVATSLDGLHWLLGCWRQEKGSRQVEECWEVGDGVLHGTNVDFRDGRLAFQESLRLEATDEGIRYVALPMGQAETSFALTASEASAARFENPEHDFPKVIAYRRDGDTLTATIGDGTEERSWVYTRVP